MDHGCKESFAMECKRRKYAVEVRASARKRVKKGRMQKRKSADVRGKEKMRNSVYFNMLLHMRAKKEIMSSQIIIHTERKKKDNEKNAYSVAIWPLCCSICDFIQALRTIL